METIRTTCPYCGVGCGVKATPGVAGEPHNLRIEGDDTHPANFGRLCVKGAALAETVGLADRLLYPEIRDGGRNRRASWDEALDLVAGRFKQIIAEHGPGAVAFYVSGQLLTEDYYVANKLMKGYIGTANIDTNSRLCMASAVAGHKRAFGEDIVPVSYEDLDLADLIVLVGSNTAWCHPVLYQRIARAKEARPQMKVVVIDPRRTASCDIADLHLPLKGGTDVWLFNGLLCHLERQALAEAPFVSEHTAGAAAALAAARESAGRPEAVAKACGLPLATVETFYRLFAAHPRVITAFSQGVNQSSAGTDKVNSIINCHLYTGRIGKPGAGPFSITGQPNAMGGREVGGLATMLAAHMEIGDGAHRDLVREFWGSPAIADRPGFKAVEMFDAIHDGRIKAVWIMATNPVVSLPDANKAKAALSRCELVVVSDVTAGTDTAAHADVLLPALAWGEKDGTVTNSDRRISRQRAFLPAPGEARADWWIVVQVARRMGFAGFDFEAVHEVFDEHARLSAFCNEDSRCFHIGGLAGLGAQAYDALTPVQWPVIAPGDAGTARLFGDARFYHPDRKAHFVATAPRAPANLPDEEYPFVLNTGRVRDHWHTMTRTGKSPKLSSHLSEPYVEMHSYDAMLAGVQDGALVRVATAWGAMVARLRCTANQTRRSIFVPIHWNDQFASDARVGALVNPAVDPISGEPEFKHTPAKVEPFLVDWHAFILSRRALKMHSTAFWVRVQGEQFQRYELAGRGAPPQPAAWSRLLREAGQDGDWLEYSDDTAHSYRAAAVHDDRIESCVFVSARPDLPSRAWLSGLFAKDRIGELDRIGLLVGQPATPEADVGPTVCSCFGVGRNTILEAIRRHSLGSAQQVGARLKAGTNCGSCVPELKSLIEFAARAEA